MNKPQSTSTLTVPITGQAETADGFKVAISGSMTINLTVTEPTPTPPPVPGPGISVDRVTDANGATVTSAVGGSIVYLKGSGMGEGGTAIIAGMPVVVMEWAPWQIACRLPIPRAATTGRVTVMPTGMETATAKFSFTITG